MSEPLADAIEALLPEILRRCLARIQEDTGAWDRRLAGLLEQLVAALRQPRLDEDAGEEYSTTDVDVDRFLHVVRLLEDTVYDALEQRAGVATIREMRVLAGWFTSLTENALRSAIRRFTTMLDAIPDEIQLQHQNGRVLWMNRALTSSLEALTGLQPEQMLGREVMSLLKTADDRAPIPIAVKRYVEGIQERVWSGEAIQGEFLFPTEEGLRWRSHSVVPVRARGRIEAVAVISRDVHTRKIAETRLHLLAKLSTLHDVSEHEGVLGAVAHVAIPEIADWSVVSVVEDGHTRRGRGAHRDLAKLPIVEQLLTSERANIPVGEGRIFGEREIASLTAYDRALGDTLAQLGTSSVMVVPFVVLGATIAEGLFVFTSESGRHHGPDDLMLAQEVARRAAHIIENARLHERLRQSDARLRVALTRSNIAVFEEDTEFKLRWIYNSPFGDDATASSITTQLAPSIIAELEAVKRRVLESGEGASTGCDFVIRGEQRHFFIRFEPLRGVGGVQGITGAAFDVTELKRAHEELAHALAFGERVMGVLGHDLRNPLAAVTGLAGLFIMRDDIPEAVREGLERMLQSGQRMNEIIETVLDFTRLRYVGGQELTRTQTALDGIVRPVVDELRVSHPRRAIEIVSADDLRGAWDVGRIGQVVSNLVGNALAHGTHDEPVRISLRQEDGLVEMVVENRGPTIPREHIEHLFEPFWQAPVAEQTLRRKGLGLGLWIVSEIVRLHAGTIAVRSSDGVTAFSVRLPR